jgi:transcriptional regulator with XRE-family HTH domain
MAHRIKRLRKRAGLTQEQLAKRVGVSRSAVALWETENTKTLRPEHLFAAADALGVDPRFLSNGTIPVASSFAELPPNTRTMIESYLKLPSSLQDHVSALVRSMAASGDQPLNQMQDEMDAVSDGKKRN